MRVHAHDGGLHQQGVAIGLGFGHIGRADIATGARLVFDHHRLPEQGRQLGLQDAHGNVGAAARGVGHDDGQILA